MMKELIERLRSRRLGILFILKMISAHLWNWKPSSSMKNTAKLASHLACGPLALLELIKGTIPNEELYIALENNNRPKDAQGLVRLYENGLKSLIEYLKEHIEDAREEKIDLFYAEHPSSIYNEVFSEIGHEWFHLGQ